MTTTTPAPARETLFSLSEDLLALDALLTESDGELTPEVEAWMAEYRDKLADKVDGIGWFWRTIEARIAGFKAAQDDLARKRQIEERKIERLKGYVASCLVHLGTRKLEGPTYTLAMQKNGGKAPLRLAEPFASDPSLLPPGYRIVKYAADLAKLREVAELDGGVVHLTPTNPEEPPPLVAELLPVGESVRLR